MKITVSPFMPTFQTVAKDLPFQNWLTKLGQHATDSSSVETLIGVAGEVLKASRSGSRIFYEYAGTKGDSWVFHDTPIVLPPSTSPQKDWTHIKE
jgi:hypothetical protein